MLRPARHAEDPTRAGEPAAVSAPVHDLVHDPGADSASTSRMDLLAQQIADLDERMQAGAIAPAGYQQQRTWWKDELVQLLGQ